MWLVVAVPLMTPINHHACITMFYAKFYMLYSKVTFNCILAIIKILDFQPKIQPNITFSTVRHQWLGIGPRQAQKCLQINPKFFQQVVMKF